MVELLASLVLMGAVGLGITSFMSDTLRRAALSNRMSTASQELQNATQLIAAELRLSSQISPYLPGTNASLTSCGAALTTAANTMSFLVAHDSSGSSNGMQRYLVGYRYDPISKQLLRGAISSSGVTSCSVPSGDPTSSANAAPVARNIVRIDANGDGSLDQVFSRSGNLLSVNLGVEVTLQSGLKQVQPIATQILLRGM